MIKKAPFVLFLVAAGVMTINAATVRGVVKNNARNPAPLANAIVSLASIGGTANSTFTDTTDAGGQYGLLKVSPGFYRIQVSREGYIASPQNQAMLDVVNASDSFTINLALIPRPAGTTISGTVTDSATGAGLAKVNIFLLQQNSGYIWTSIDSVVSSTNGSFQFDSIVSGVYRIVALRSGYREKSVAVTVTNQPQTIQLKLLPVIAGRIIGRVTRDSSAGPALAGVRIILQRRPGMGTDDISVDTAVSDANGFYSFADVIAGLNYDLVVSKGPFDAIKTIRHNLQSAGTDTVNVFLSLASILVIVGKRSDSTRIPGASVALTLSAGGATATGATSQGGMTLFPDVPAGRDFYYSITASAPGFSPGSALNIMATPNRNDTVRIFLSPSTAPIRTLTGTVTDSATRTGIPQVCVILQITVGGSAGPTLVLFDSTDAGGVYAITGIPLNALRNGTVSATCFGYRSYGNQQVMIGAADTSRLSFSLVKLQAGTMPPLSAAAATGPIDIGIAGKSLLRLRNIVEEGAVFVFSPNGKLVYHTVIPARTALLPLPCGATGSLVVCITQKNRVYRKLITVR